jgi:hypothetical protein
MAKRPKAKRPKKSSASSSIEDDVTGYVASIGIDSQADYVARGRQYKDLSEQDLTEKWVQAVKRWADNPRNREVRAIHSDLDSEFQLRGKNPPNELVREHWKRLEAAIQAVHEELQQDPETLEEINRDLMVDIEAFKARRDKSKN